MVSLSSQTLLPLTVHIRYSGQLLSLVSRKILEGQETQCNYPRRFKPRLMKAEPTKISLYKSLLEACCALC